MSTFSGRLLITDREALLSQVTAGGMTVQTPILMDTNPPSAGSTERQMAFARTFFVDEQGQQTGASVTINGTSVEIGEVPAILMIHP